MQIIPFMTDEEHYNVFIALEEKNLQRMKLYDPAQFGVDKLPPEWQAKKLSLIIMGYATDKDLAQVKFLIDSGAPSAALEFLSRGFAFLPKLGDNDRPYKRAP